MDEAKLVLDALRRVVTHRVAGHGVRVRALRQCFVDAVGELLLGLLVERRRLAAVHADELDARGVLSLLLQHMLDETRAGENEDCAELCRRRSEDTGDGHLTCLAVNDEFRRVSCLEPGLVGRVFKQRDLIVRLRVFARDEVRRTPGVVLIDADDERRCADRRQRVAVVVEQHGVAQLHRRIGVRDAVDILNVGDDVGADFVVGAVVAGDAAPVLLLLLGRAAHIDVGIRVGSHHLRDLVVEHLAEAE